MSSYENDRGGNGLALAAIMLLGLLVGEVKGTMGH